MAHFHEFLFVFDFSKNKRPSLCFKIYPFMNYINQCYSTVESRRGGLYHIMSCIINFYILTSRLYSLTTREEGKEKNISQFMIRWLVEVEDHLRKILFMIEIIIYKFGIKKYLLKELSHSEFSVVTTKCIIYK